jgi:excisionase family DNA binding protein
MPVTTLRTPKSGGARDGLWTLDEAAHYLQIAPGTLKHWTAERRIEFVKVGKFLRFTQAGLDRYIASQTVSVTVVAVELE